ncbi:MAG: SusD/RagB family nutrient-binding outer membrane lipoprotein, partial [Bacteroidota bacterium]
NKNPNETLTTDSEYLFRYSLKQGIGSYNSDVNLKQWGLMTWMMYFAPRGGVEPGKEYVVPTGKDAFWTEQYADALCNINEVILVTDGDDALVNKNAAARIWRVWLFHRITDLWGSVPYSDALKGLSDLNYTPAYDTQESIYLNMLDELTQAEAKMDAAKTFFDPSADLICKGSVNNWKIFANALRMRLATRIKDRLPSVYSQQMTDLSGKVCMSSNSESVLFPFGSGKRNPVYEAIYTGQSIVQSNPSKFLVDMLVNSNDPRIKIFFKKTPMSVLPWIPAYNGVPNLLTTTDPAWSNYNLDGNWGDISRIGFWFTRDVTPGVIISYSEVCFLKAEAAMQSLWPGSAQTFYENGVAANIESYNVPGDTSWYVTPAIITSYLSALPAVSVENIITQKWISFAFDNGYEAYAEYRRTGFPRFKKYDGSYINESTVPTRMIYPNYESTLNNAHYLEAIELQGPDNEFVKVWWDKY